MRTGIRLATRADLPDVARVRAEAWAETYPGLLPDAVIKAQFDRTEGVVRRGRFVIPANAGIS